MNILCAVPVTIQPPHPQNLQTTLPTVRMIVEVSKSVLMLSNQNVIKMLKSQVQLLIIVIVAFTSTHSTSVPGLQVPILVVGLPVDQLCPGINVLQHTFL